MVRVTVVIPTYNFEMYIAETISSVLAQSLDDIEVLVFDNASTDSTREVVSRFQDPRLRYHCNERNLGLFPSVERAFAEARGQYVVIVGADDILERNFLEVAVDRLSAEPQLSMLHGAAIWIDENGTPFGGTNDRWRRTTPGEEATVDMFRYGFCLTTMVVPTQTAQALMPFKREWDVMADAWFFLKLCLLGDIGYLHEPLVRYRVHEKSLSLNLYTSGQFFERHLRIAKEAFEWPEMKARGLQRYRKAALRSVAREAIRLLHGNRLGSSRRSYLRYYWLIVKTVPSVLLYPESWLRLGFGMMPVWVITKLRQWKRGRWFRRANKSEDGVAEVQELVT